MSIVPVFIANPLQNLSVLWNHICQTPCLSFHLFAVFLKIDWIVFSSVSKFPKWNCNFFERYCYILLEKYQNESSYDMLYSCWNPVLDNIDVIKLLPRIWSGNQKLWNWLILISSELIRFGMQNSIQERKTMSFPFLMNATRFDLACHNLKKSVVGPTYWLLNSSV